jgi:hypothetical protein
MRLRAVAPRVVLLALGLAGCSNAGGDKIVSVRQTGIVQGQVAFDVNGSGAFEQGTDTGLAQIGIRLVAQGTRDTLARASSGAAGAYTMNDVPIGTYVLFVDTSRFGDSILVEKIDSSSFTVRPGGTVTVNVEVGYPRVSIGAARALAPGRRVVVVGVALNGSATFADSVAGLADASGTVLLTRVRSSFLAGDSLRVLGTTAVRSGQPTLDDPTVYSLGQGRAPTVAALTTVLAAGAAGGTRDAQLVSVAGATISDTARTSSSFVLTVNDGSGPLQVQLDRTADPAFQSGNLPGNYVPGNKFDVLGLLVPAGVGAWRLRPRSAADLSLVPLPVSSIAAARALPPGLTVTVVGVALNNSTTFADTSVFLADTSGAIRLTQLRATVATGDSVKLRAVTASRNGQPTLDGGTTTALGRGFLPSPASLTTAGAASAAGGTRDAQLVRVSDATISDTARTSTSFVLTVSDGSGSLQVQLDQTADPAFQTANLPGAYVPGNKFNLLGILVPTGTGAWRLRPRSSADLTFIPLPVISIRAARALAAGQTVAVVGVVLNNSATFADTSVFLADTSGAIRLTRLKTTVATGDSVKVTAVTASRSGQPTLDGGTTTSLGRGFVPTPAALTTATAASAAGGTRDAQLVSVAGATISDTSRTSTSFVLTVSDGSGSLQVQLDSTADAAFRTASLPGNYIPGNKFDLLGVLVPTGSGTWRLRPRSSADVTLIPLPVISIRAARALPSGQTVLVVGVALNGSTTFADTAVFLTDTSGAIRLTQLRATVAAGDSVKVRAVTGSRNGQPTLDGGTTTALGRGFIPTPPTVTTAVAASAAGGTRDAQLVSVPGAVISDTARTSTSFLLTVSDGSGSLVVQLDQTAGFVSPTIPGVYVPGNKFDLLGVLAPTGTGSWRLRPRSTADLTLIPLPVISIAAARALPAGQIVAVVGVALNSSSVFSDTTVHLADTSGAIRLTRLKTTLVTGDSVKFTAVTASRAGQPTLDAGTSIPLGPGLLPTAPTLTTAVAATAAGGTRDAQLVVTNNATINATATVVLGGVSYYSLTVSDGSGNLQVLLDPKAGFVPPVIPGIYLRGYKFNIIGVLVPTGTGSWMLKPRSTADLTPLPSVISIKAARALPAGQTVIVVGVALNGSGTFSDTTVHLVDTAAAVRLTRPQATVAFGDSVQITAVTASRAGQPTLDSATSSLFSAGHTLYGPTPLTTAAAASAGSTRDAQLARVTNATISAASTVTLGGVSYWSLTVSDGSGNLQVLLDPRAGFVSPVVPGIYVAGNTFNIVGLLVPTGTGSWLLKPRATGDLTLPVTSIRAARGLPAGRTVAVVGVALNGWATFADTAVHLADTSGAIRLTRLKVPPTPVTGDSIQVVAMTSSRAGQPTLDAGTPTALGTGQLPAAPAVTTLVASGAQGGALDAHLVVVNNATISDTTTFLGNFRMTVSDGSGNLTVQLDQRAGFTCQAPLCTYLPANTFNIIGVLTPTGTGSWMLKPRTATDLTKL